MRQWLNVLVILIVVTVMAAFTMSSIVAVVTASAALQRSLDDAYDMTLVGSSAECDRLDINPCHWSASTVSASSHQWMDPSASSYDAAVAVSPTEAGSLTTNVDP